RSVCPDQVPWSMRVNRSWETLSNASAMAKHGVRLVKYSTAMRYIHSGSGIDAHLPSESLCLFLCRLPVARISSLEALPGGQERGAGRRQRVGSREKRLDFSYTLYGWFTEGFDTPDLQEARALLDALA